MSRRRPSHRHAAPNPGQTGQTMTAVQLVDHLRSFHPDIRVVAAGAATAVAARYDRETLDLWHAESPHRCAPALRPAVEVAETRAS